MKRLAQFGLLLALAALVGYGVAAFCAGLVDMGRQEVRSAWDEETAARANVAMAEQKRRQDQRLLEETKAQEVDRAHQIQLSRLAADAAGARSELDGLRLALEARRAASAGAGLPGTCAAPGKPEQGRAEGELLEACAARYSELAADTDQLAEQLAALQALKSDERVPQ